jgi:predicted DsbA family dithiol-disulfide isomerase
MDPEQHGSQPAARVVEVFADVCCPFTHVGLVRFVEARQAGGGAAVLHVRSWPLELVNGRPLDAGFIAEEIEEIREQVAPELFAGFRAEAFPESSLPAMALAEAAYRVDVPTGEAVSLALRHALFEEGQDIADAAVLAAVAARHGLDPGAVRTDDVVAAWEEGRARGVIGSPHFFTPAGGFFCPALDIRRVDGHLRITADAEGFAAFLASCFES